MAAMNQRGRRRIIVISIVSVVLVLIGIGAWYIVTFLITLKQIPQAYAAWTAADLVIDHMEAHDGAWPEGWEDLFHAADIRKANGMMLQWKVEELPSLVAVDWSADPAVFVEVSAVGDDPPFLVVTRPDGTEFPTVWQGRELNEMILDYLRKRRDQEDVAEESE